MEFDYPLDYSLYNNEEIIIIINYLDLILESSDEGVALEKFKNSYNAF